MSVQIGPGGYGTTLLAVAWAEFAIALLLLLARTYTTWRITRHVKIDLHLTLLTFAVAVTSMAFLTLSITYGLGEHKNLLSPEQISLSIKWSWMNQVLAIFAIALGKLAIVAFLQQIHGPEDRGKVILLWGVALSNLVINTITIGMILTQCTPRHKLWDEEVPGKCDGRLRNQNTAYFQGSWSALCDLILALYPVVFFWNVRLNIRVKVGLCVLMGLGVIACVCSIVKTTYLQVLSETHDPTYYIAQLITWNETEMWVVLIVGCIPPIRPLLMVVFHKVVSTARSATGRTDKNRTGTELQSYSHASRPQAKSRSPGTTQLGSSLDAKDSEENILSPDANIVKTTDFSLSYETGSTSHPGDYQSQVLPNERL
ncbi:hypothetical protein NUU61_003487 [Penicillium alfredii]|uniref:Rhodopsin domain-containing protein n=1 Tax=Penicillium alfredii TaxID=1506179 RepID=A0A9W9KCE6_9EURO|nr:uncharacterized protein NUU61_003487 [Penicillium alfredii]KAJ5101265.1 hypothetical protein NUU61_003487 [Penicillium alfredii]